MAINFEAANMAGYNNPKIEVFTVVSNDVNIITSAPTKTEIYNSITRGSIPFVLLIAAGEHIFCTLSSITGEPEKNLYLHFGTPEGVGLSYQADSELPIIVSTP